MAPAPPNERGQAARANTKGKFGKMARTIKNRELNLLLAMDRGKQRRKAGKGTAALIVFAVALAAAVAVFYIHTASQANSLTERIGAVNAYMQNPETQQLSEEAQRGIDAAEKSKAKADVAASAVDSIDSYPDLSASDLKTVFKLAGKNVDMDGISYDRQTGEFSFTGICRSATRIPIFIAALRSTGIFSSVAYEGYTGGTYTVPGKPVKTSDGALLPTQVTVNEYTFSVTCTVNTAAQRAAQDAEAGE
jgi:hypothetical protein